MAQPNQGAPQQIKEHIKNPNEIKTRADFEAKQMNALKQSYTAAMNREKDIIAARKKAEKVYTALSKEEKGSGLGGVYVAMAKGMEEIGKHQNEYVTKVNSKIIPAMTNQGNNIGTLKKQYTNYDKKHANKVKKETAFQNQNIPEKKAKAEGEMNKALNEFNAEHVQFTQALKQFQSDRVSTNKAILTHLVNSELFYHVKAIETLTSLANLLSQIEEKTEAEQIFDQLVEKK